MEGIDKYIEFNLIGKQGLLTRRNFVYGVITRCRSCKTICGSWANWL